jgi:hypothetical protein
LGATAIDPPAKGARAEGRLGRLRRNGHRWWQEALGLSLLVLALAVVYVVVYVVFGVGYFLWTIVRRVPSSSAVASLVLPS